MECCDALNPCTHELNFESSDCEQANFYSDEPMFPLIDFESVDYYSSEPPLVRIDYYELAHAHAVEREYTRPDLFATAYKFIMTQNIMVDPWQYADIMARGFGRGGDPPLAKSDLVEELDSLPLVGSFHEVLKAIIAKKILPVDVEKSDGDDDPVEDVMPADKVNVISVDKVDVKPISEVDENDSDDDPEEDYNMQIAMALSLLNV